VVIIIGVVAAYGIPRLIQSVEQAKASEAFKYLSSIRDAQERNSMRNGEYASTLSELDFSHAPPTYFSVGSILPGDTGSIEDSWQLTLTRQGASGGFGAYDVTFSQRGYDPVLSSIESHPDIHPMSR
ncbi:MAG: hypothetical protein WBD31_06145, partial [Rubripirellula sp.]